MASPQREIYYRVDVSWIQPFRRMRERPMLLVRLYLPVFKRHMRENVFVIGVVPGPKEPELLQVSNFLNAFELEMTLVEGAGEYLQTDSDSAVTV